MKKLILVLFMFSVTAMAQHTRRELLQPDYDSYNLCAWPRQMTVIQKYEQGNDINFQETYLFDSVGNLTEYRKRGFGGERVTHYPLTLEGVSHNKRYTFDFDGDVLELRQYDSQGRLNSSTHYIYGDGGNLVMAVEYTYAADSGVVAKRSVSTYDKHERLVSVEQYSADELLLRREKRKYDRRGNLIRRTQTFYDGEETETTVERRDYTYDRRDNWVQCRYSLNGKYIYTIERTIEYY